MEGRFVCGLVTGSKLEFAPIHSRLFIPFIPGRPVCNTNMLLLGVFLNANFQHSIIIHFYYFLLFYIITRLKHFKSTSKVSRVFVVLLLRKHLNAFIVLIMTDAADGKPSPDVPHRTSSHSFEAQHGPISSSHSKSVLQV